MASIGFKISDFVLQRKINLKGERKKKAFSLDQARSIAVIYPFQNPEINDLARKLMQFLLEERKVVTGLTFINEKMIGEDFVKMPHLTPFCKKDLNFLKFPVHPAKALFEKDIDVLIDLSLTESTAMKYIFALSPAKFKVSASLPYQLMHGDMTIAIDNKQSTAYLIEQIIHYLNQVNSKKVVNETQSI